MIRLIYDNLDTPNASACEGIFKNDTLGGILSDFPDNFVKQTLGSYDKNTNGYSLMTWANTELTVDSVVLSTHDSISLLNNKSFYYYFLDYVDFENNSSQIFIKSIEKNNINTVLFFGHIYGNDLKKAPYFDKLENCLGNLISHKKNVGRHVGRNPFQQGSPYGGWLFEFNVKKFPQCLK